MSELGNFLIKKCIEPAPASNITYEEVFKSNGWSCPTEIVEIEKDGFKGGFINHGPDENWRFFGPEELSKAIKASSPMDVAKTGLVALIDCMDNMFICYDSVENVFVLYVMDGDAKIKKNPSLAEILRESGF